MKSLILAVAVAALPLMSFAATQLEPVTVVKITQSGNLMPGPVDTERVIDTEIELNVEDCSSDKEFSLAVKQTEAAQVVTIVRGPSRIKCMWSKPEGRTLKLETTELRHHKAIVIKNPVRVITHFVH